MARQPGADQDPLTLRMARRRRCLALAALPLALALVPGAWTRRPRSQLRASSEVVPIGPFCPFASPGLMNLCTEPQQRPRLDTSTNGQHEDLMSVMSVMSAVETAGRSWSAS